MKRIIFTLVLLTLFCGVVFAGEQVWVKSDANLDKKPAQEDFEVTEKMKTDILKLSEITVQKVKSIIRGSSSQAKQVIEEMVKDGTIKTKEARYSELFPSAAVITP